MSDQTNELIAPQKKCPACGQGGGRILVAAQYVMAKRAVYRCPRCRTAFFLERQQEPDYWQATGQEDAYAEPAVDEGLLPLHATALTELDAFVAQSKNKTLLDVGCGDGMFLKMAKERGWEASGLEASPRGAELARSRSGCPVRVGVAEDLAATVPLQTWDVITLWDVIEHLPDPLRTVRALSQHLAPGGILALRTPNESSAFRALARGVRTCSLGLVGGLLKYVYYHSHYVTFTAEGLTALTERAGLTTARVRFEETPLAFAREKIRHAYQKYPGHQLLIALLPIAYFIGKLGGQNKLVFYASAPQIP